jgi:hypothetical protein
MKSGAMLARFQRTGGKVEWLTNTPECVSGRFSHPSGGSLVITWDDSRVRLAGLEGKDMHRKFPIQMKRARCISEAVRALAPGSIPVGMYTVEESQDMDPVVDVTPVVQKVEEAVAAVSSATALTDEEVKDHLEAISAADPGDQLRDAFASAYKHAKEARDIRAKEAFEQAYKSRKEEP